MSSESSLGKFRVTSGSVHLKRWFIVLLVLAASLFVAVPAADAQLTTQGEPAVGNTLGTKLTTSQALLDATMFTGADMCASIAAACVKLGTTNYPTGATGLGARACWPRSIRQGCSKIPSGRSTPPNV